jgi:hypothetical protein
MGIASESRGVCTCGPWPKSPRGYNLFLLLVAGSGGLLYGIDVRIIGGALPYLEATSHLDASQLSVIVAAVLLESVFSTLFAGTAVVQWIRPILMARRTNERCR